jgi:HPt (histidine-containing phosphotransfer) domain-containing protein
MTLNLDYLKEISGGDRTFEKSILEALIETAPELISNVENGVKLNDYIIVRESMHKVKPSLLILGLTDLHALTQTTEKTILANQSLEGMEENIHTFLKSIYNVIGEIKEELKSY